MLGQYLVNLVNLVNLVYISIMFHIVEVVGWLLDQLTNQPARFPQPGSVDI